LDNIKIKIVYFVYLKPNEWEPTVLEQLNSLKSSGLYDDADEIYVSVCSNDTDLKRFKQHLWSKFKKISIINLFQTNAYEYPGFKAIWDLSQQEESLILYFHTKGMTSDKKYPERANLRKFLFEKTISNYKEYITEFKNNKDLDIGCIFPSEFGFSWFNFFWVRSTYVNKHLPQPQPNSNRYYWERYIGSENSTKKDVKCYSPLLGNGKLGNKSQLYQWKKRLSL
jgi:hypothetical protein